MDKLPEELLIRVFRCLQSGADLCEVVLVNKKFARIATPVLYEKVSLDHGPYKRQNQALRQMLNTLVSSPSSRCLVRQLEIGHWKTNETAFGNLDIPLISLTDFIGIVQCLPALTSCPPEFQRKFGVDLLDSSLDAMLTAVLNLLPNLTSLDLTVNRCQPMPQRNVPVLMTAALAFQETLTMGLVELLTTQSLSSFPVLGRLSYVRISEDIMPEDSNEFTPGWNLHTMSLFLRLPTLKTFVGSGCSDFNKGTTWACVERASSVISIELYASRLGVESLRKILRACKALETFVCTRFCPECSGEHFDINSDCSYVGIHNDLYYHRQSLTDLRLLSDSCSHASSRGDEPVETLFALNELRNLIIDESVLLGHRDNAPRSLSKFFPPNLRSMGILVRPGMWQDELLFEIGRCLLSNANLPAVDFHSEIVPLEIAEVLKELPGIAIEITEAPESDGTCDLRMYRIKSEENPLDSIVEGGTMRP